MTDFVTVKVHGLEELERNLNELPEKLAKTALRTASRKSSQVIQQKAQSLAPQSGLPIPRGGAKSKWRKLPLRVGIRIATKVSGQGVTGGTITTRIGLDKSTWYGRLLEFGTKYISRRPFLGPAFESLKSSILDTFKDELAKAIKQVRVKNKLPV